MIIINIIINSNYVILVNIFDHCGAILYLPNILYNS